MIGSTILLITPANYKLADFMINDIIYRIDSGIQEWDRSWDRNYSLFFHLLSRSALTEEVELHYWPRLLTWELQRGVSDSHLWLSLWDRPPRSPFTRLQRVTCCSVLLHLFILVNTVWYATVTYVKRYNLISHTYTHCIKVCTTCKLNINLKLALTWWL